MFKVVSKEKFIILLLSCFLVFLVASPVGAARGDNEDNGFEPPKKGRGVSREQERMVDEASQDISNKLGVVLKIVAGGGSLKDDDVKHLRDSLRGYRSYLTKMEKEVQCQYYMLNSWASYFFGDYKKALREASLANKASSANSDGQATLLTMAVLNKDYRSLLAIIPAEEQGRSIFGVTRHRGRARSAARSSRYKKSSELGFNIESVKGSLLGKEVSSCEISCLNGSSLSHSAGGNVLCVMFWKQKFDSQETEGMFLPQRDRFENEDEYDEEDRGSRRRRGESAEELILEGMSAFGELFSGEFENSDVKFATINVDEAIESRKVMSMLLANSWPWPQAVAAHQDSEAISQFAGMYLDEPVLVIVGSDGQICYAGPVSGVIPRLILSKIISMFTPSAPKETADSAFEINRNSMLNGANKVAEPAALPEKKLAKVPQIARDNVAKAEQVNPQAENWYQMALVHKKSGKILGYKRMVDYCRKIIENYPDSSHAKKARELLRELPEKDRRRHNLTNEEMGL